MSSTRSLLVATFVLFVLIQVSVQKTTDALPQKVIDFMGSRPMRYHHFLWHQLRENWLSIDASTQHAIRALGWEPPRPSLVKYPNGTRVVMEENGSGEDFLYMHRQMVQQVNEMVADTEYEKIVGFKTVPYPGDPKWPVPPVYTVAGNPGITAAIARIKGNDFFWSTMQPADERLSDPEYLRSVSLAKLGSQLEYTVHEWLHLRMSEVTEIGLRPADPENIAPNVDPKWDNTTYQWLGDTYSSHVGSTFWKIHGWVDDRIEMWRVANGLDEIEWENTWENGPLATLNDLFAAGAVTDSDDGDGASESDTVDHNMETMEKAFRLLAKHKLSPPFTGDVKVSLLDDLHHHH